MADAPSKTNVRRQTVLRHRSLVLSDRAPDTELVTHVDIASSRHRTWPRANRSRPIRHTEPVTPRIGYSEIVSYIAAGSTGNLVQQSRARLCGVVIGTYDYSNSAGGKGHAVSVVGMFDLPDNRDN